MPPGTSPVIAERIRRPIPADSFVLAGSLPIVSFGDPDRAVVATLSLNPSWLEFQSPVGNWLLEADRRLASLKSIGISDPRDLDDAQVAQVAAESNLYFRGPNWYKTWFHWLEALLTNTGAGSYLDGSACHLDLVQWATKPAQGQLPLAAWDRLVDEDRAFLQWQLRNSNVSAVLINGVTAVASLVQAGLVGSFDDDMIEYETVGGRGQLRVFRAVSDGVLFLGWNKVLAGAIAREGRRRLTEWVEESLQEQVSRRSIDIPIDLPNESEAAVVTSEVVEGFIPMGTKVDSVDELARLLANWLRTSNGATVGEVGAFGGSPVITVCIGADKFVLNRDTKRAAVEAFLEASARSGGASNLDWYVTENSRGKVNRVTYRSDEGPTPGWYAYVHTPELAPRRLG
jgi:hypothetical protein